MSEPNMIQHETSTPRLLARWHAGDRSALHALIEQDLGWIRAHVQRRVGGILRARGEPQDYVQDAMLEVLRYRPSRVAADRARFRRLLARIIENVLRDRHDWFVARRRAVERERPMQSRSAPALDLEDDRVSQPSEHAVSNERRDWVRRAIDLLEPRDRRLIRLRQWDELSFAAIGEQMGIAEDAARMRFRRLLPQLADRVAELRRSTGGAATGGTSGGWRAVRTARPRPAVR